MTDPVLAVDNLATHFFTRDGVVKSVDGISFTVAPAKFSALSANPVPENRHRLFDHGVDRSARTHRLGFDPPEGEELVGRSEAELRKVRGRSLAMIFQDPMMTLNPVLRIDTQMMEAVQAHESCV